MGTCVCALASCGGMLRPAINFSCSSCLGDLQHFTGQTSCQSRVGFPAKLALLNLSLRPWLGFIARVRVSRLGQGYKTELDLPSKAG